MCTVCAFFQLSIRAVLQRLPVLNDVTLQWCLKGFVDGSERPMVDNWLVPLKAFTNGERPADEVTFIEYEGMEEYLGPATKALWRKPLNGRVPLNMVMIRQVKRSTRLQHLYNSILAPAEFRGPTYSIRAMLRDARSIKSIEPFMPLHPSITLARTSGK